jgi:pentatricopeptide repeat protein
MTSLINAALNFSNSENVHFFNNYVTDIAVGVLFGIGYFLVKKIRNKLENNNDNKKLDDKVKTTVRQKLESALERWNFCKTLEEYNNLIKSNTSGFVDPNEILNIMQAKGITPTIETYNILMLNCFHVNNFTGANFLLKELLENSAPIYANRTTLSLVIKGLSINQKINKLTHENFDELIEEEILKFKTKNIEMDVIAYNTLLDAYVEQQRLEKAYEYYQLIISLTHLEFDTYTYSTMLKGIRLTPVTDNVWFTRGLKIYDEFLCRNNNQIDYNILSSFLDLCIKFNKFHIAEKMFNDNILSNNSIETNIKEYTFCIMIKGYSKLFQLNKALNLFQTLRSICVPGVISYGCILNACVKNDSFENFNQLLNDLRTNKIELNAHIISIMINGFKKFGSFKDAYETYQESLNIGITSTVIYNAILETCVFYNKMSKMQEIYQTMKTELILNEECSTPDLITYSIVIKGYLKNNNIKQAMDIYNFLLEKNQIDEVMFNTILDCFTKTKDESSLNRILFDMKNLNIPPSVVTYGVLIKFYVNYGNQYKANKLFTEMISENIKPTVVIYQLMIKLNANNGNIETAIELFRKMLIEKITPDHIISELIISACLYYDYQKEAYEFINIAINHGIKLDTQFYSDLVRGVIYTKFLKTHEKKNILSDLYNKMKLHCMSLPFECLETLTRFIFSNVNKQFFNNHSQKHIY